MDHTLKTETHNPIAVFTIFIAIVAPTIMTVHLDMVTRQILCEAARGHDTCHSPLQKPSKRLEWPTNDNQDKDNLNEGKTFLVFSCLLLLEFSHLSRQNNKFHSNKQLYRKRIPLQDFN